MGKWRPSRRVIRTFYRYKYKSTGICPYLWKKKGADADGSKKDRPVDWKNLTEQEKMKYEIAGELGLLDQVMREGWKSLSSKETGRIGGLMTKKRRQEQKK